MSNYYEKYTKYKQKYLILKKQEGNGDNENASNEGEVKEYIEQINNDNLVDILKNNNCKDIIKLITSKKIICKFRSLTKEQWYQLIDNIEIENYLRYSETNPENPEILYKSLMTQDVLCTQNIYCRLFFTKCLHKHLIEKYNNNDLTKCWYKAIRENNTDDYQYFDILINTTKIGDNAFNAFNAFSEKLVSVTIPNSVTSIGYEAFAYNELTSVTIPDYVTTIGYGAFINNKLKSVVISKCVTKIGSWAFGKNELTCVTIPNSVTKISEWTFARNKLIKVTIPNRVTSIENGAFENNELTSVVIPNSVTKIDSWAFKNNNLTTITIPNSVEVISYEAFLNNKLTSVTIPKSVPVNQLAYNAFDKVTKIIRN